MTFVKDDGSFFEKERDRLTAEITASFEELLPSSNQLNRKLEEVLGMTREYETIAALWQSFHELMRNQRDDDEQTEAQTQPQEMPGMSGTGGRVLKASGGAQGEQ